MRSTLRTALAWCQGVLFAPPRCYCFFCCVCYLSSSSARWLVATWVPRVVVVVVGGGGGGDHLCVERVGCWDCERSGVGERCWVHHRVEGLVTRVCAQAPVRMRNLKKRSAHHRNPHDEPTSQACVDDQTPQAPELPRVVHGGYRETPSLKMKMSQAQSHQAQGKVTSETSEKLLKKKGERP